jgi:hypothetical protein
VTLNYQESTFVTRLETVKARIAQDFYQVKKQSANPAVVRQSGYTSYEVSNWGIARHNRSVQHRSVRKSATLLDEPL